MNANTDTVRTARIYMCFDCGNEESTQIDANQHHKDCDAVRIARAEFVRIRMERFGHV